MSQELERSTRDIERLKTWLWQLNRATSAMLNSRRWKAGYALARPVRKLLGKPPEPPVPPAVQKVRQEFGAWQVQHEQEDEERAREPRNQQAPARGTPPPRAEPAGDTASPKPTPSNAARALSGFSEHILEALKDAPPVTVLVPIHNSYGDVKRCLEALIRNTTSPAEFLLIDDASTDGRVSSLPSEYGELENVRVLTNEENLGFTRTVNRGFSESRGDMVLLDSDTEVTPRWLENLRLAAYRNPRTATVTPVSNSAGAFSVPEVGEENQLPDALSVDNAARLVTQQSARTYPETPTGNGFCMYIKREALDDAGHFDAESFPHGYGEENEFCMRAGDRGWNHVVDDSTLIRHRRSASFGDRKQKLLEASRGRLDELYPEYTQLARRFVSSGLMQRVRRNVSNAYGMPQAAQNRVKPRVLFVMHQASGGTPLTNRDLMQALSDRYWTYLLVSDAVHVRLFLLDHRGLVEVESRKLRERCVPTEFSRPDYREIVFDLLTSYRFEMVHIRHLLGHTFDLPEIASLLDVPVVLSFHDFFFSCPTIHLLDDHGKHCGGVCTPGHGQCTIPLKRFEDLPVLKHAWLKTWRRQVERMFEHVDAFVTTSEAAREIHLRSLPSLERRPFRVIEHGRDLEQAHCASPPGDGPVKILIPGNINAHKGAGFIRALREVDSEGRLEFHFLGQVAVEYRDLGVMHGTYDREEFNERVRQIAPSFMGIFSIWPETYCHTLTESWAAGVPVLASDIGTLRERVNAHGGGWLVDFEDPEGSYRRILEIAGDRAEYERGLAQASLNAVRSVADMAADYGDLYESVLAGHRQFR